MAGAEVVVTEVLLAAAVLVTGAVLLDKLDKLDKVTVLVTLPLEVPEGWLPEAVMWKGLEYWKMVGSLS